eukprot:360672-Chlamydomonas_euryale.AAC.12
MPGWLACCGTCWCINRWLPPVNSAAAWLRWLGTCCGRAAAPPALRLTPGGPSSLSGSATTLPGVVGCAPAGPLRRAPPPAAAARNGAAPAAAGAASFVPAAAAALGSPPPPAFICGGCICACGPFATERPASNGVSARRGTDAAAAAAAACAASPPSGIGRVAIAPSTPAPLPAGSSPAVPRSSSCEAPGAAPAATLSASPPPRPYAPYAPAGMCCAAAAVAAACELCQPLLVALDRVATVVVLLAAPQRQTVVRLHHLVVLGHGDEVLGHAVGQVQQVGVQAERVALHVNEHDGRVVGALARHPQPAVLFYLPAAAVQRVHHQRRRDLLLIEKLLHQGLRVEGKREGEPNVFIPQ